MLFRSPCRALELLLSALLCLPRPLVLLRIVLRRCLSAIGRDRGARSGFRPKKASAPLPFVRGSPASHPCSVYIIELLHLEEVYKLCPLRPCEV